MRVNPDTISERDQQAALACNPDERLAHPIEVECPCCGSMEGESCVPLTGAPLVGRYHEDRRVQANHTFLPRAS